MAENTLSVLKIAPGQHPQQVEIDNNLKALQEAVGGTIAAVYPFADPVAIICNDDGKLMGLPLNRSLRDENGEMYDAVAGTFLVVGLGEEDFASLTPELAQKYEQLPITLTADHVAAALGISRANAYILLRSDGFPTLHIGKRMVVPKDRFLQWISDSVNS